MLKEADWMSSTFPEAPTLAVESLPSTWTLEVAAAAWAHAVEAYPQEAVGVVEKGAYERFDNRADNPSLHVSIDAESAARLVPGTMLVHSHPDGWQCPSAADMRAQSQLGIPFMILPIGKDGPTGKAFSFGDATDVPLLGRPFRHGKFDCYSLVRDYYKTRGLALSEYPRDWEWWSGPTPLDLYTEGFSKEGFVEIAVEEATQEGDALLCAIRARVPQHAAIVLDRHRILHHPAGLREYDPTRLSCIDIRSTWARFALRAVRHA
jgi:cell wall-associated NlpC family hydrolase